MKYAVLIAMGMCMCGGNVAFAAGKPNAMTYSYKIWPHGRLASSHTATANTPFGTLTCSGGKGYNEAGQRTGASAPRSCHW